MRGAFFSTGALVTSGSAGATTGGATGSAGVTGCVTIFLATGTGSVNCGGAVTSVSGWAL